MKPRLRLDRTRPGTGKWECVSDQQSFYGNDYQRVGKGYTLQNAYAKWLRCGKPHSLPLRFSSVSPSFLPRGL
jgi:hypothetical protein